MISIELVRQQVQQGFTKRQLRSRTHEHPINKQVNHYTTQVQSGHVHTFVLSSNDSQ